MLPQRRTIPRATLSKILQLIRQLNANLLHASGHCPDQLDAMEIIRILNLSPTQKIYRSIPLI
jgi:hypothetical protein